MANCGDKSTEDGVEWTRESVRYIKEPRISGGCDNLMNAVCGTEPLLV